MKKKFYLTMMLLLSMAVGTTYADDDPSVVTLYEVSFESGLGNFQTFANADRADEETINEAWHYNATLQCAECSGDEGGYLASPLITVTKEKKYCDITLWVEHEGQDARQGNTEMKILTSGSTYWERYQPGGYSYPEPHNSNQFDWDNAPLDAYAQGSTFRFAIYHYPSSSGYYRIKSIKITARDWTLVEGLTEINAIKELYGKPKGTPFKLNMNGAKIVWKDEGASQEYIYDGTGGIQVGYYGYVMPTFYIGSEISGYVYGYYQVYDDIPYISKPTMNITSHTPGNDYSYSPTEIAEAQYSDNMLNYVKMPVASEIVICDNYSRLGYPKSGTTFTYKPIYESYVIGIPIPTSNGEKKILATGNNSVIINLPDVMETPLSDNELGLWGVVDRKFKANDWYSLCLPIQDPNFDSDYTCARFVSSLDGNLEFATTSYISYGEPYLIKFNQDCEKIEGIIYSAEPKSITGSEYNFVGTLQTVSPKDGSLYLTSGNTIRPLATGGKINAFRAYFEPNTPSAARTRSIVVDGTTIATGDGTTTDIEDILNGRTNGNGEVYNLNGQRVNGNSSQKGVYIINGKKVIK